MLSSEMPLYLQYIVNDFKRIIEENPDETDMKQKEY
jgi:hypothetical protein